MKQEIERKFLVNGDGWRAVAGSGSLCRQGYLSSGVDGATVRIRRMGDNQAWLTIKGPPKGISRAEFEYPVPVEEADYMLAHLCNGRIVSKTRFNVEVGGVVWEIDEFDGENDGLILAEVELDCETQPVDLPEWIGQEVSTDKSYTNVFLSSHPYKKFH